METNCSRSLNVSGLFLGPNAICVEANLHRKEAAAIDGCCDLD